jgi:hypothetical protein
MSTTSTPSKLISFRLTSEELNDLEAIQARISIEQGLSITRSAVLSMLIGHGENSIKNKNHENVILECLQKIWEIGVLGKSISIRIPNHAYKELEKFIKYLTQKTGRKLSRSEAIRLLVHIGKDSLATSKEPTIHEAKVDIAFDQIQTTFNEESIQVIKQRKNNPLRKELNQSLSLKVPDRSDLDFMRPKPDYEITSYFLDFFCSFIESYYESEHSFDGYCATFNQTREEHLERFKKKYPIRKRLIEEDILKRFPCEAVRNFISNKKKNHPQIDIKKHRLLPNELYFTFFHWILGFSSGKAASLAYVVKKLSLLRRYEGLLNTFNDNEDDYLETSFHDDNFILGIESYNCVLEAVPNHNPKLVENVSRFIEDFYHFSYFLKNEPVPQIIWYDLVYQDEDLMDQFLIQMAEFKAPQDTFRKYARDMFGDNYFKRVNDLSNKHECLRLYREGDDGGGVEYLYWEHLCEVYFEKVKNLVLKSEDSIKFEKDIQELLGKNWLKDAELILLHHPDLELRFKELTSQSQNK